MSQANRIESIFNEMEDFECSVEDQSDKCLFLTTLIERVFFEDTPMSVFIIHSPQMRHFGARLFDFMTENLDSLTSDLEVKLTSFMKVYLNKAKFATVLPLIEAFQRKCSDYLENNPIGESGMTRLLSFMHLFVHSNLIVPKHSFFVLSGVDNTSLQVRLDRSQEASALFLNRSFTVTMSAKVDFDGMRSVDTSAHLLHFKSTDDGRGYGLRVRDDQLSFFYDVHPNERPTEISLFSSLTRFKYDEFMSIVFCCDFDSSSLMTTITVSMRELKFQKQFSIPHSLALSHSYTLSFLVGVPSLLSSIIVLKRALTDTEMLKTKNPKFTLSFLSPNTFEGVYSAIDRVSYRNDLLFLIHPFDKQNPSQQNDRQDHQRENRQGPQTGKTREDCLEEQVSGVVYRLTDYSLLVSYCRNHHTYALKRTMFFEFASLLFKHSSSPKTSAKLLRIMKCLNESLGLLEAYSFDEEIHPFKLTLIPFLFHKSDSLVDKPNLESLVLSLTEVPKKFQQSYVRKLITNFGFMRSVLVSEDHVRLLFDFVNKIVNDDFEILKCFDFNALLQNAILFIKMDQKASHLTALHIFKLIACSMSVSSCAQSFDIRSVFLTIFSGLSMQSVFHIIILKIIKEKLKSCGMEEDIVSMGVHSLCHLLSLSDDSMVISKTIGLLLLFSPNFEALAILSLRNKFQTKVVRTSKHFFVDLKKRDPTIAKSEVLIRRAMGLCFKESADRSVSPRLTDDNKMDLLMTLCCLTDEETLGTVMRTVLASLVATRVDFVKRVNGQSFMDWIVMMKYHFAKHSPSSDTLATINSIVKTYCTVCIEKGDSLSFANCLCESVHFHSMEFQLPELKYLLFMDAFEELSTDALLNQSDKFNTELTWAVIRYYCVNLRFDRLEDSEDSVLETIVDLLHTLLVLNPSLTLINVLLNRLSNDASLSQFIANSVIGKTLSRYTGSVSSGPSDNTTLKAVVVFIIDLMEHLHTKNSSVFAWQSVVELVNGLIYRLFNCIGSLKSGLSVESLRNVEFCLFHLFSAFLRNEKRVKNIEKIVKSVVYFSDDRMFNIPLSKRLTALLRSNKVDPTPSIDYSTVRFDWDEFKDEDFVSGRDDYLLQFIGVINGLTPVGEEAFVNAAFLMTDHQSREYKSRFESLLNWVLLRRQLSVRRLHSRYHKMVDRLRTKCQIVDVQSAFGCGQQFEYPTRNAHRRRVAVTRNSYVTSQLKQPFVTLEFADPSPDGLFTCRSCPGCGSESGLTSSGISPSENQIDLASALSHWKTSFKCHLLKRDVYHPVHIVVDEVKKSIFAIYDSHCEKRVTFFQNNQKKTGCKIIRFSRVKRVTPNTFLRKSTGCIMTLTNRKQVNFDFNDQKERDGFFESLFGLVDRTTLGKHHQSEVNQRMSRLMFRWRNHEASNFKTLMKVNIEAGRTFNDYSQYPVFPILMTSFEKKVILRDLSRPAGMAGDPIKSTTLLSNLKSYRGVGNQGSGYLERYYSHPNAVLSFLRRMDPHCRILRSIPPQYRLHKCVFRSVCDFLKSFREEVDEWREGVPEMFYCPQMLIDYNDLDRESLDQSDEGHVSLPEICAKNPDTFLFYMSQMLEGSFASSHLNAWIDLIFGHKQSGEEAKRESNAFPSSFYPDPARTEEEDSTDAQTRYYQGSIPKRLFDQAVIPKSKSSATDNIVSVDSRIKYFVRVKHDEQTRPTECLLMTKLRTHSKKMEVDQNRFIVVTDQEVEVWRINSQMSAQDSKNPFKLTLENKFSLESITAELDSMGRLGVFKQAMDVSEYGKLMVGGMANGSIVTVNYLHSRVGRVTVLHDYPINKVHVSLQSVVITSDAKGIVIVSRLDVRQDELTPLRLVSSFFAESILNIRMILNDKQLFSVESDRRVSILSTDCPKKHLFSLEKTMILDKPNCKVKDFICSFSYLSVLIVYESDDEVHYFTTINMTGKTICTFQERMSERIRFRFFEVVSDDSFKDFLACVSEKGDVMFVDLPFFQTVKSYKSHQSNDITQIEVVNNSKTLLLIDDHKNIQVLRVCDHPDD